MKHPAIAMVTALIAFSLALPACEKASTHGHDHDHDHAHSGDDHDHAGHSDSGDHDHDHADAHGNERSLGAITVAGTTFDVSVGGSLEPNNEMHIGLKHTDGPMPNAVRLWIGDEAGTDALKAKADQEDNGFHAHAEVPAVLTPQSALWIEVEGADGERTTQSVSLID